MPQRAVSRYKGCQVVYAWGAMPPRTLTDPSIAIEVSPTTHLRGVRPLTLRGQAARKNQGITPCTPNCFSSLLFPPPRCVLTSRVSLVLKRVIISIEGATEEIGKFIYSDSCFNSTGTAFISVSRLSDEVDSLLSACLLAFGSLLLRLFRLTLARVDGGCPASASFRSGQAPPHHCGVVGGAMGNRSV